MIRKHKNSKQIIELYVYIHENGNIIVKIYNITEVRRKFSIKYNLVYMRTWIVKKDGIAYKIFSRDLSLKAEKPMSKELMAVIGD